MPYLNTDLDLISRTDPGVLVRALEARGLFALHLSRREEGLWFASLETVEQHPSPESNLAAMVAVVESLPEAHRNEWLACSVREFNIGHECGAHAGSRSYSISSEVLARVASIQATLGFTIYSSQADK